MPFPSQGLGYHLESDLKAFAQSHDFASLYKVYEWGQDRWPAGFRDILRLELETTGSARRNHLNRQHVLSIATWGKLRNIGGVKSSDPVALFLYHGDEPAQHIQTDPVAPLRQLRKQTKGLGPTYLSKILRFALPQEYGALDTRLLRVIGIGDSRVKRHNWLSIAVKNYGYGWYIAASQHAWPGEYSRWINILRFLAHWLNSTGKHCPHPTDFVRHGLRKQGMWACADVEMALFSYTSTLV